MFTNRQDAGRRLAQRLLPFKDRHPIVLALPRGGVVVGAEVAAALDAPLDVVLVRKIGAPWQPELAVGAVVDGTPPMLVINRDIAGQFGLGEEYFETEARRQIEEIERRRRLYGSHQAPVAGRTAIVVDDGIATGATVRAALRALRQAGPAHLVLAVPVAPPDTIAALRAEVDEIVCLEMPAQFGALGFFYEDFTQVSDEEVIALLDAAARPEPAAPPQIS